VNELIEQLKKLPRWAWWAVGGTVLAVIAYALWARRRNTSPSPGLPAEPAPEVTAAAPAESASNSPTGGRDPDRNGDTDSWLRSALGGLLSRSTAIEMDVARIRAGLATQAGAGMGTGPNKASIATPEAAGMTAQQTAIAAGAPTAPAAPTVAPFTLPAPDWDPVREIYDQGGITKEQLTQNFTDAGKPLPGWLESSAPPVDHTPGPVPMPTAPRRFGIFPR